MIHKKKKNITLICSVIISSSAPSMHSLSTEKWVFLEANTYTFFIDKVLATFNPVYLPKLYLKLVSLLTESNTVKMEEKMDA